MGFTRDSKSELSISHLTSLFQESESGLFLYQNKQLLSLHLPPYFAVPHHLEDLAGEILTSLNHTSKQDHWRFLDFGWKDRTFAGSLLYCLKIEDQSLFIFVLPLKGRIFLCTKTLCQKYGLTTAQCGVLEVVLDGASNKSAAEKLGVSLDTIKSHLQQVFQKLEVHSRWELLWKVLEMVEVGGG